MMNININNQAISLHSIPNSFFEIQLEANVEYSLSDDNDHVLPVNASFVKVQSDKDVFYLSNQNTSASVGFRIAAHKEKVFSRREALGLCFYATENTAVKIQPLSHN